MTRSRILLAALCLLFSHQDSFAQTRLPDASPMLMNLIREEKFKAILPPLMRDNGVDMWLHVKTEDDLLDFELGDSAGVFVFTDRGETVERAVFGGRGDPDLYDVMGAEGELASFISERDPKRIAVSPADGREKLGDALDREFAARVVPGKRLVAQFLAGRGMAEVALFGRLLVESMNAINKDIDAIVPGVTKLSEIPGNVFVRDLDGNEENNTDYVVQPGDLIGVLQSADMMDFSEHNGGIGYVLREGETGLPPEVRQIFEHALTMREIFREHIQAGPPGGETVEILIDALEKAGYVNIERDQFDPTADPEKTQVFVDFHALGRLESQENAPRFSRTGWGRDLPIPLYHTFALEYMLHMPVPAWGKGKHLYICIHDGAVVTDRGVEFPAPPIQNIRIIR